MQLKKNGLNVIQTKFNLRSTETKVLVLFVFLIYALFLIPIVIGLIATILPAFSYFPALGYDSFSFDVWSDFFNHSSVFTGTVLSLTTGLFATIIALFFSFIIFYRYIYLKKSKILNYLISPMLAIPHAAFAIAFILLFAPSGWLIKIVASMLGWVLPPNIVTVQDSYAISLMVVLIIKEIPFLLLMLSAQLPNYPVSSYRLLSASLGYSHFASYLYVLVPQLLKSIRLPIYAVLAYGLTNVDVSQIIGPNAPPTLGVLIHQWFSHSDLSFRLLAAAGSVFLLIMTLLCIGLFYLFEKLVVVCLLSFSSQSKRSVFFESVISRLGFVLYAIVIISILAIVVLILWSVTFRWGFSFSLPQQFSFKFWSKSADAILLGVKNASIFAFLSTVISMVIVIGALEYLGSNNSNKKVLPKSLIYLPLLLPQMSFLFGFNVFLLWTDFHFDWLSVLWAHSLFVLPYIYLTLHPVFNQFDKRYVLQSYALNHGYLKTLLFIKIPMLKTSIYSTFALGFSVSVVQYLPTLYMGEGRIETITTQMVNMASGSDYRRIAIFALCQTLLPMVVFILAFRKKSHA
ncbi:ABC transporter permease [Marinicellulosiphila megalodicopiae]|uniref:ABC transporter permease n=1 Tax=Marinicellulosiphila megalodicopiae TaxID=2724896 RepID=UPI003BB1CA41